MNHLFGFNCYTKMKINSIIINALIISLFFFSCKESNENPVPNMEIPNADFENWEMLYKLDKPIDWGTSNLSLYGVVTFNTVKKDGLEKYSGNFSSKLETKSQIIDNSEVKVVGL